MGCWGRRVSGGAVGAPSGNPVAAASALSKVFPQSTAPGTNNYHTRGCTMGVSRQKGG